MSRDKDYYKEVSILEELGVFPPEPDYHQRFRFDKGYKFPIVNQVSVAGCLIHDPPIRWTKRGIPVTNFVISTKPDRGDKTTDDMEREPCFVSIVVWSNQALQCKRFLKKGSVILVIGELQSMPNSDPKKKFCPVQLSAQWIQYLEKGTVQNLTDYMNSEDGSYFQDEEILVDQIVNSPDSLSEDK